MNKIIVFLLGFLLAVVLVQAHDSYLPADGIPLVEGDSEDYDSESGRASAIDEGELGSTSGDHGGWEFLPYDEDHDDPEYYGFHDHHIDDEDDYYEDHDDDNEREGSVDDSWMIDGDHGDGDEGDGDSQLQDNSNVRHRRSLTAKPCGTGCAKCGALGLYCEKCKSGYKSSGAGCTKITTSQSTNIKPPSKTHHCKAVSNCLECPGTGMPWFRSCKKCAKGWHLYKVLFRTVCTRKCPKGYQAKGSKNGLKCSEKLTLKCPRIQGCETCPSSNSCVKCAGNLILHDGVLSSECVKKCPYSYRMVLKNGKKVCKQQDGCYGLQCHSCKSGWFKANYKGTICHKQCPPGFTLISLWNNSFCKKCAKDCKKCDTKRCQVCNSGRVLHHYKFWGFKLTSCLKKCPSGYRKQLVRGNDYECRKGPATGKPAPLP